MVKRLQRSKAALHVCSIFYDTRITPCASRDTRLIILVIGSKATATFTDSHGKAVTLKMKGGWFDHTADIVDEKSGRTVARIDRKLLSGRDLVFGQQTYAVVVAPGVDAALIAGLCICFDEKNNESS